MQTLWSSGASNRTGSWMLHQSDIYIVRPVIHPTTRNEMVKNLACSLDHRLLAPQNVVTVVLMVLNSGLRGHTYSSPWSCRWNIEDGKCNLVHHCQDTFWIAHTVIPIPKTPACSPSSCRLRLSCTRARRCGRRCQSCRLPSPGWAYRPWPWRRVAGWLAIDVLSFLFPFPFY